MFVGTDVFEELICSLENSNQVWGDNVGCWSAGNLVLLGYAVIMKRVIEKNSNARNRELNLTTFARGLAPKKIK